MASSSAALPPRYFLTAKKHKASLKRTHEKQDPDYIPTTSIAPNSRPLKRTRRNGVVSFKPKSDNPPPSSPLESEIAPSSPDTVIPITETNQPEPPKHVLGNVQVRISKLLPTVCLPPRKRRHRGTEEKQLDIRASNRYQNTKIGICDGARQCATDWCCTFHLSPFGSIRLDDLNVSTHPPS